MHSGAMPTAVPTQGRSSVPYYLHPDYRIHEFNKRLQQQLEVILVEDPVLSGFPPDAHLKRQNNDSVWWDSVVSEFFEDDAVLTLHCTLDDGPKKFTIGRPLIPRYFRSIFDGGVTELYYVLFQANDSYTNNTVTLTCDKTSMVTGFVKPSIFKVCTEGQLTVEFTFDDLMRIRKWKFVILDHKEMIPRSSLSSMDPKTLEQLSKNVTRQGISSFTLNYLRLCVILEPMQELMSKQKALPMNPRECMKAVLYQKWQARMMGQGDFPASPMEHLWTSTTPEPARSQGKTRKRRSSNRTDNSSKQSHVSASGAPPKKKSPMTPQYSLNTSDVMVVGEPTLMGGEFGDEDERLITRLENTQFGANSNGLNGDDDSFNGSPLHGSGWNESRKLPKEGLAE